MYAGKGDVPFIKVYNLTDRGILDFSVKPTFIDHITHSGLLARSRVIPGDVLINIVGPPLGKVAIVPDDFPEWNINQAIVVFRPLNGILNKYLAFAFLTDSIMRRVTSLAKATAGQFNIGVGMCRRLLPIPIAPTNEQRRIVAKIEELFSDLDAGVAALERAKANLKRYRASVLKAAVEGKLTEGWRAKHPNTEPASKLLERILTKRRKKWEADQLAKFAAAKKEPPKNWREKYVEPTPPDPTDLPKVSAAGWSYCRLDQIFDSPKTGTKTGPFGSLLKKHEHLEAGIPVIGIENIGPMTFQRGSKIHISVAKASEIIDFSVLPRDIVISRSGTVGEVCVIPTDVTEARMSTNLMRIRLYRNGVLPDYLCLLLHGSPFVRRQIHQLCSGSTRDFLNTEILLSLVFPLPPREEQEAILGIVSEELSRIAAADLEIDHGLRRAARLRQSILKQAFEGKLVPQDPKDEPASVLLERLRASRSAHDANGKAATPARPRGHRAKQGSANE